MEDQFRPVVAFLCSERQAALNKFRAVSVTEEPEIVKAQLIEARTTFNAVSFLLELPEQIKKAADQQERIGLRVTQMKAAQEGGEL